LVVAAAAPGARADLITPDSVASPIPLSPAFQGANVPVDGQVWSQYQGRGVLFSTAPWVPPTIDAGHTTAVAVVNGVKVWVGASSVAPRPATVDFSAGVTAQLVAPGTTTPALTDSLRVKVVSAGGTGFAAYQLSGYDAHGHLLLSQTSNFRARGSGDWLTLSAKGIQSIHVTAVPLLFPLDPVPGFVGPPERPFAWGVAAIDVAGAPEPTGLALAGLGLAGWIGYAWRRRRAAAGADAGGGRS
jgi:hypothetical protein